VLISCGVAQIVIVYVERYKTLVVNCVTVTLLDKDKWSAAIVCVNKYQPSIQNTIMSYVWQRHIGCSYGIYICVIDSSQYSYLIQITVKTVAVAVQLHNTNLHFVSHDHDTSGKALTNKNCIRAEIKSRLNWGNVWYRLGQNILYSCQLSRSVKIHRTIIFPVFYSGDELSLSRTEEHRLRVLENRVLQLNPLGTKKCN